MRKGIIAALAAACLVTPMLAEEPASAERSKGSLFERFRAHTADKKDKLPSAPLPKGRRTIAPAGGAAVIESVAELRQHELEVLFRRQAVCEKLREIAMKAEPVDAALLRKAEQLDQRAWSIYQQRTNQLASGEAGTISSAAAPATELDPGAVTLQGN